MFGNESIGAYAKFSVYQNFPFAFIKRNFHSYVTVRTLQNFHFRPITQTRVIVEVLKQKHPPAKLLSIDSVISSENPSIIHPIIFDALDTRVIRSAALRNFGSGGPSGTDAHCWRQLCTCFKRSSDDLCHALAKLAQRLFTEYVHPAVLSSLLSCRLIALNKNPGIRPIGVCETMRRIVAKAALRIIRQDILETSGSAQLCAGQLAGVEAAFHAVRSPFCDEPSAGILLVQYRSDTR